MGIKEKITSPTFVIQKKFQIQNYKPQINYKFKTFYHMDCYRLNKPEEILELDFKKIISDPKNVLAIEWPEKIKKILPKEIIFIEFKFVNQNKREINFKK